MCRNKLGALILITEGSRDGSGSWEIGALEELLLFTPSASVLVVFLQLKCIYLLLL